MTIKKTMALAIWILSVMPGFGDSIDPHLAFMEPLLGKTWQGFLKSPDGKHTFPEIQTFELMENGNAVRMYKANRELGTLGEGYMWWNKDKNLISLCYTENIGVIFEGTVGFDGKKIILQGTKSPAEPLSGPERHRKCGFRNIIELLSETSIRSSWFQNEFGHWCSGQVIELNAVPAESDTFSSLFFKGSANSKDLKGGFKCL